MRAIIALATILNLVIHQMNVKIAFLNGDLKEEIYMKQLEDFIVSRKEHKVCKLRKPLYGLKQAPRQWYENFNNTLVNYGFVLNSFDSFVHLKMIYSNSVDDMLIFGTSLKVFLSSKFEMKDVRKTNMILANYVEKLLRKFNDVVPARIPYDSSIYLNGGTSLALSKGFCDANWVSDNDKISSSSMCVFTLGTRSIVESEFIALELVGQEVEWLRGLTTNIPLWGKLTPFIYL
ncbi:hypothetical protein CR513_14945, partial [Mucuna pruriens]